MPKLAITSLKSAVETVPENPEYLRSLCLALKESGKYREALAQFEKLRSIRPNTSATWFSIGECHAKIGENKASTAAYERSIELDKNAEKPRIALARALIGSGETESLLRATLLLDPVLKRRPRHIEVLYSLQTAYVRLGQKDKAAELRSRHGAVTALQGKFESKLRSLRKATQSEATHEASSLELIQTYLDLNQLREAFEQAQSLLLLHPRHVEALHRVGELQLRFRKKPTLGFFEGLKLIEVAPLDGRGQLVAGQALLMIKRVQQAAVLAEKAHRLRPNDHECLDLLVRVYQQLGGKNAQLQQLIPRRDQLARKAAAATVARRNRLAAEE